MHYSQTSDTKAHLREGDLTSLAFLSTPVPRQGHTPKFQATPSRWWDSNPQPPDYKSSALPTELHRHILTVSDCKSRYKKFIDKIFGENFLYFFISQRALSATASFSRNYRCEIGCKYTQLFTINKRLHSFFYPYDEKNEGPVRDPHFIIG